MRKITSTTRTRLGQFAELDGAVVDAPTVPEDLSSLSDEELGTLYEELQRFYDTTRASGAPAVELVGALQPITAAINAVCDTAKERLDAAAAADAALAELDASLPTPPAAPEGGDPAPAPAPAASENGSDPAPVVASGNEPAPGDTIEIPALPALPRSAPASQTVEPIRPGFSITAAGDVSGWGSGDTMPDMRAVAAAMISKRRAIGKPGRTGSEYVTVASVHADWPEERHLNSGDSWQSNQAKLDAVTGPEALVASGGLCAPVQPYYEIMTIAEAARPVRDSLAAFQADRGGIRLIPPPQLSAAAGSVGFITAAIDSAALGGNATQIGAATKPCLHVTCPTVTEYDVAAVTRCLEFGNITARAYPEQVTAWLALATAQHARKAETALIDGIATNSTQVTQARVVGAARDVVATIVKAAAYYRNHNRMLPDAPLRVMMPAWVIDLMVADMTHGSGYEMEFYAMARAEIDDALGELNVNVSYYLDSGTGKGQLINAGNAQTATALTTFPSTVVWYLFSEGSFLFLDAGTLDFGIVRDSSLNSLNNYRIFAETLEGLAYVGVESLEVTQTVIADGTYAGPAYGSSTLGSPVSLPTGF